MIRSQTPIPAPVHREEFIDAMRAVASSVTVVTTDGPAGRHVATVSAFCSVSADPPSALVCLRAGSRIAKMVAKNVAFSVNVLPQTRQDIDDRLAGRHDHEITDRFDDIDCQIVDGTGPALEGATLFSCILSDTVDFGSHCIFIGHVIGVREGASVPLTYLNGAYHHVVPQSGSVA